MNYVRHLDINSMEQDLQEDIESVKEFRTSHSSKSIATEELDSTETVSCLPEIEVTDTEEETQISLLKDIKNLLMNIYEKINR